MIKKLLIFLAGSLLFMVSVLSISAQDIDIDSMDNEQLMLLLQSIMNKLEQEETDVPGGGPDPAEIPDVPAAEPASVSEVKSAKTHQIYEVKKLSIERIPDDRFIPKPKEGGGSDGDGPDDHTKSGGSEDDCTAKCMGYSEFYGIMMLDMGCYSRCLGD